MLLDQIFRGASLSGGKLIAQFCQREGVTEEAFRFGLIGLYGRNREAPCWDGAVETIDGALGRLELPELAAGDRVRITYDGEIAESYPAQIFGTAAVERLEEE